MITKVKPDRQKSESLKKMAEITLERLDNTDMEKYPSNTLLDYYDYVAKQKKIDEHMRQFLQQMRDYRNRISYDGFIVHKNYVSLNKVTIRRIIKHLFEQLELNELRYR